MNMKIVQAQMNRVTLVLALAALAHVTAFVSQLPINIASRTTSGAASSATRSQFLHRMMDTNTAESLTSAISSSTGSSDFLHATSYQFLVATIDADIANISDNEFAPIFAGGILVMFGGVLSALIVGFILDSTNSYAEVIADSYAQSAEDEDFWKGLSEEERKKTKELLQKVKDGNEGKRTTAPKEPSAVVDTTLAEQATQAISASQDTTTSSSNIEQQSTPTGTSGTSTKDNEKTMFSDY